MKVFAVGALVGAVFLIPLGAFAGPFGLTPGTKLSSLKVDKSLGDDQYQIEVPDPNSEFEGYVATVTKETGLCKIVGVGRTHRGDFDGADTKSTFQNLKNVLSEKYGTSKDYDYLRSGSIWNENSEWAMAISQNQRSFSSFWGGDTGATLPQDISYIALIVHSTGQSSPFIVLGYEFRNFAACNAGKTAKDNGSL